MSQSRQNMRSAFSEFEPEVSDAHVEQSWEKIQYFLPQKKKRRAFFLPDFSGFAKLAAVVAIVALGFLLYPYDSSMQKQTKQNTTAEVRTPDGGTPHAQQLPEPTSGQPDSKTPSSLPAAAPEQNAVPGKEPETIRHPGSTLAAEDKLPEEKTSALPRREEPVARSTQRLKATEAGLALANTVDETNVPADETPQQTPADSRSQAPEEPGSAPALAENGASERTTTDPAQTKETELLSDRLSLKEVTLLTTRLPDSLNPSLDLSPVKGKRELLLMSVRRKILVEAAAGPGLCYATIDPVEGISNEKRMGLSATLGAAYYFKNRWSISAHALYSSAKWEHTQERQEGFEVIRRRSSLNVWSGGVDTTKLVEVKSRVTLSSRADYAFGLGIANEVWRSEKLSIEPFIQVAMRYSEYRLTSRNVDGTDTIYVTGFSNAPGVYRLATPPPEYSENHKQYVFGIVPGLNINYWISPRLALFAKPQFMAQLSAEEIKNQSQSIKLRQDRLSLMLGARIKIGG